MAQPKEGAGNATWDREIKMIFCEICLKEVLEGNRLSTHFNREGWLNVTKHFLASTGRNYDRMQLKNKWDQLKKDWKTWKELKHGSTGLGWDNKKKSVDASDEWWTEKLRVIPHAKKFRYAGIDPELEDKLDQMFTGVVATGDHAWAPSQDVQELCKQQHEEIKDSMNDLIQDSQHNVEEFIKCSQSKHIPTLGVKGKLKKKKGATFLREQISQLVTACASSGDKNIVVKSSISDAIHTLEEITEIFMDIPFYIFATQLLEDDKKREIFMAMAPDRRTQYLRFFMKRTTMFD